MVRRGTKRRTKRRTIKNRVRRKSMRRRTKRRYTKRKRSKRKTGKRRSIKQRGGMESAPEPVSPQPKAVVQQAAQKNPENGNYEVSKILNIQKGTDGNYTFEYEGITYETKYEGGDMIKDIEEAIGYSDKTILLTNVMLRDTPGEIDEETAQQLEEIDRLWGEIDEETALQLE